MKINNPKEENNAIVQQKHKSMILIRFTLVLALSILVLASIIGPFDRKPRGPNDWSSSTFRAVDNHSEPPVVITNATYTANQHPRYCKWSSTLEECGALLRPRLLPVRHWVVAGDSTMRKAAKVPPSIQLDKAKLDEARCGEYRYNYFRCPDSNKQMQVSWIPPNSSYGEGPGNFGLKNPTCMDCGGCSSFHGKVLSAYTSSSSFEYLGVEYARDVELPCASWNSVTTQETMSHYLSFKKRSKQKAGGTVACLINAGLHDNAVRNLTIPIYVRNVREYLRLLKPGCDTVIWLGISAVSGDHQFAQRNSILKKMNEAVFDMILNSPEDADFLQIVHVVDVWEKTTATDHVDNVHLIDDYYSELAEFFFQNMTSFVAPMKTPGRGGIVKRRNSTSI